MNIKTNKRNTKIGLLCLLQELQRMYVETGNYKPMFYNNCKSNYNTKSFRLGYIAGIEFALIVLRRHDLINCAIHETGEIINA